MPIEKPKLGTTPFPNVLIDEVLPRLRDTELRLLLVILRQTWGWHKERDWLSHAQLRDKTGRASAALSRAIAVLAESRLIVVRSRSGEALDSSWARRREHGGLHFGLHPTLTARLLEESRADVQNTNSQTRNDNKKVDKRKAVVVVDQFDQPVHSFGDAVAQNEQRPGGEVEEERHPPAIKDPVVEAHWRRVGEELRGGKHVRWKRGL